MDCSGREIFAEAEPGNTTSIVVQESAVEEPNQNEPAQAKEDGQHKKRVRPDHSEPPFWCRHASPQAIAQNASSELHRASLSVHAGRNQPSEPRTSGANLGTKAKLERTSLNFGLTLKRG